MTGDGAEVLVQAWATRHTDGTVDLLLWNGTVNSEVMHGDRRLHRTVDIELTGLTSGAHQVQLARIDAEHSNVVAALDPDVAWPDADQWKQLREADFLYTEDLPALTVGADGGGRLTVRLPQPGVLRLRLRAAGRPPADLAGRSVRPSDSPSK
jgi:xylan 1,4-beta-xylosidase